MSLLKHHKTDFSVLIPPPANTFYIGIDLDGIAKKMDSAGVITVLDNSGYQVPVNFATITNPLPGQFFIGFDLDGVFKKKDSAGVITPIEVPNIVAGNIFYASSIFGNNLTAVPGDPRKPYASITAAMNAATPGSLVVVLPGDYVLSGTLDKVNINYYFYPGAQVSAIGFSVFTAAGPGNFIRVRGEGRFFNNGFAIPLFSASAGAFLDIKGDDATHDGGFYSILTGSGAAQSKLTFNTMTSSGGRGDIIYLISGHSAIIDCPRIVYSRIAIIIEDATGTSKLFVTKNSNFITEDSAADFTLFAPTFIYFIAGIAGNTVTILGNHESKATTAPLAASFIMNPLANTLVELIGNFVFDTVNAGVLAGTSIVRGYIENKTGSVLNIAGGNGKVDGKVVNSNVAVDTNAIVLDATGTFISMYAYVVTSNPGGTATSISGAGASPVRYAMLVTNYAPTGVVNGIAGSTLIADVNVS